MNCFIRRKLEPLDCAMADFNISLLDLVEFDTYIICHVLVYSFGSFLLQDMFSSLQVFAFEDKNMTAFTVNVLLTCILNCYAGPGY